MDWPEIIHWILQAITAVGLLILGLLAKHYRPIYITEKGKNLATKEDIGEITREIEKLATIVKAVDSGRANSSAKVSYAHQIEPLRPSLGSREPIYQVRYEREFDLLLELSERLVELRDAVTSLRPSAADFVNPNESEEDRKRRRLARYTKASRELYLFAETRRPFFPQQIYTALQELDQVAWGEVVQCRHRSPHGENYDPDSWDDAEQNSQRIRKISENALHAIRERMRLWEKFDPGP